MSFQLTSEQLATLLGAARRSVEPAGAPAEHAPALLAVEDVDMERGSPARLLITAPTRQSVETLARRIHGSGPRAQLPFVITAAGELAVDPQALKEDCVRFLDAAAGGTVLVSAVEEMPTAVQETFIDLLVGLESARRPSATVRLISATTVSLLDRIAAGSFSERLFYRLNIIHLIAGNGSPADALI